MKVSIKKHLKGIIINFIIMLITYIVVSLIIHGSFSGIDWFPLIIMLLSYLVFSLLFSYQKEKGKSDN